MEFAIKVPMGHIKVEGDTPKDLFRAIADAQEVFGVGCCKLCNSGDVRFVARTVTKGKQEFEYFELRCESCEARLHFGSINDKTGRLFPRKKLDPKTGKPTKSDDPAGRFGDHGGWTKWRPGPGDGVD